MKRQRLNCPRKRGRWVATSVLSLVLCLLTVVARSQSAPAVPTMALIGSDPAATAYSGPRFPGGPDSLRAFVRRALRPASATLVGEVFLCLELDSQGHTSKAYFLTPPAGSPAFTLTSTPEVQALVGQLVQRLPPWQLGSDTPGQPKNLTNSVILPLTFGPAPASSALEYSEENPLFPAQNVRGRQIPNLIYYVQTQVRYPADDLRHGRQGVVYAYLEVSETGALEKRQIAGSVSPTLDAEIMRVLNQLPNALTPPRLQGRPVRVGYVLPFTFKIM